MVSAVIYILFDIDDYSESNMDLVGGAIHRIVIKSILEIVQSLMSGKNILYKQDAKQIFVLNKEQDMSCYVNKLFLRSVLDFQFLIS
jgi:hypothetical protein